MDKNSSYSNRVRRYLEDEEAKKADAGFKPCRVSVSFIEDDTLLARWSQLCTNLHDVGLALAQAWDHLPAIRRSVAADRRIALERLVHAEVRVTVVRLEDEVDGPDFELPF